MGFEVFNYIEQKKLGMFSLLKGKTTPSLVNEAKTNAYWKDRSSHARQNLTGDVEGGNNKFTIYLAHGVDYGEALEEGSGIYGPSKRPIVPVKCKILRWIDENGNPRFAKSVKGIKPMPILENTLKENKDKIISEIIDYWSE